MKFSILETIFIQKKFPLTGDLQNCFIFEIYVWIMDISFREKKQHVRGAAHKKSHKKWKKGGERAVPKIKKSTIQIVDYFETRGGCQIFQFFPN